MTLPCRGVWTSGFDEQRAGHVHGAQDIVAARGEPWRAIEAGKAMWHHIVLASRDRQAYNAYGRWAWSVTGRPYPFANYSMDYYGVCCVLVSRVGERTWVYAHMDPALAGPFFSANQLRAFYHKADNEQWMSALFTEPVAVEEGDVIGYVGYAGQTMPGPFESHLHIEGHHGTDWNAHANRMRLEKGAFG